MIQTEVKLAVFVMVPYVTAEPASTFAVNVRTAFPPPAILATVHVKPVVDGLTSLLDVPPAIELAT